MEYQNLLMKEGYLLLITQISINKISAIQAIFANKKICAMEYASFRKIMVHRNSLENINDGLEPAFYVRIF